MNIPAGPARPAEKRSSVNGTPLATTVESELTHMCHNENKLPEYYTREYLKQLLHVIDMLNIIYNGEPPVLKVQALFDKMYPQDMMPSINDIEYANSLFMRGR